MQESLLWLRCDWWKDWRCEKTGWKSWSFQANTKQKMSNLTLLPAKKLPPASYQWLVPSLSPACSPRALTLTCPHWWEIPAQHQGSSPGGEHPNPQTPVPLFWGASMAKEYLLRTSWRTAFYNLWYKGRKKLKQWGLVLFLGSYIHKQKDLIIT